MAATAEQIPTGTDRGHLEGMRLGARIRHQRLVHGLNLKDLANRVGCSVSALSKIENAKATPSLAMLRRIAAVLCTTEAALLEDKGPQRSAVMASGSRPLVGRAPGVTAVPLVPGWSGALLNGELRAIRPGFGVADDTPSSSEALGYVLEGALEVTVDDEVVLAAPGDSVFVQPGQMAAIRNTGTDLGVIGWVTTPPAGPAVRSRR